MLLREEEMFNKVTLFAISEVLVGLLLFRVALVRFAGGHWAFAAFEAFVACLVLRFAIKDIKNARQ